MATTTPNFGWDIPQSTDLVKDGATAIAALGTDIDTALVDLKGGTTGQVLSKNSNTDLDFTWVAQDDSNAIQNALLTTTGDTIYASGASTPARLGIGTTGQVLTVSGGIPAWATPTSGSMTSLASGSIAASATGLDLTSISGSYKDLVLVCRGLSLNSDGLDCDIRINNDSGSNYYVLNNRGGTSSYTNGGTAIRVIADSTASVTSGCLIFQLFDYANTSGAKSFYGSGVSRLANLTTTVGFWNSTSAINRITLSNNGAFDAGTYILYGVN